MQVFVVVVGGLARRAEFVGKVDVFVKKMNCENLSADEINAFKCETLIRLAKKYSELDWAMQLHIGALRNNNSAMFKKKLCGTHH